MAVNQSTLEIVLKAKDEASGKLDSVSNAAGGLSSKMKALGATLAGVFAAKQIIDFGTASFKAFADAEASAARVSATLATMGQKGIDAADAIDKAAMAATRLAFDDEDAAESITNLFQRTGDLSKAMELNQLAMDLSRAKSISLGDATRAIGMILSGNGKALKEYGIEINESLGPMAALGELHEKVGGQAQKFAETSQGSIERLGVAWENLKEKVGELLGPIVTPILEASAAAIQWATDLEGVKEQFGVLIQSFDEHTGVITQLKESFSFLVDTFNEHLKPALEELMVAAEPLKPYFEAFAQIIGGMLVVVIKLVITIITGWIAILEHVLTVVAKLSTWLVDKLVWALEELKAPLTATYELFEKIYNKIKSILNSGVEKISGWFGGGSDKGKALGGTVMAGQSYTVGENGPESFTPATSGFIGPVQGGSGKTVNVFIQGGTFLSEDVAVQIGDLIMGRLKLSNQL